MQQTPDDDSTDPAWHGLAALAHDTLQRLQALHPSTMAQPLPQPECTRTLGQLLGWLALLRDELGLQREHLHAALEARRPGATLALLDEHDGLLELIGTLQDDVQALHEGPAALRDARSAQLLHRLVALARAACGSQPTRLQALLQQHLPGPEKRASQRRLAAARNPAQTRLLRLWQGTAAAAPPSTRPGCSPGHPTPPNPAPNPAPTPDRHTDPLES